MSYFYHLVSDREDKKEADARDGTTSPGCQWLFALSDTPWCIGNGEDD